MTTTSVSVRHNFETGHRLPFLPGKCQSLHGHSWWAEVTVTATGHHDVVVEFGAFKQLLRDWIDTHLDHGLMLGADDPLTPLLREAGKVYVFGADVHSGGLSWPTVENVAHVIANTAKHLLQIMPTTDAVLTARVTDVVVQETHTNSASWHL